MKQIHEEAALHADNDSNKGFREAFAHMMRADSSHSATTHSILKASYVDTVLGSMLAIADERALFLLEFVTRKGLEKEIKQLCNKTQSLIIPGRTSPIDSIENELQAYFSGQLTAFKTAIHLPGTPFQKRVWQELMRIPYGETRSYSKQAESLGKPTAFRTVANANAANQLAIIIPCHRIVHLNGTLGGYAGGVDRKKWLIAHEKRVKPL